MIIKHIELTPMTKLIPHYEKELGAQMIPGTRDMQITERAARALVEKYYGGTDDMVKDSIINDEFDEEFDNAGVLVVPPQKGAPKYDIRGIFKYCEERGITVSELDPSVTQRFIIGYYD